MIVPDAQEIRLETEDIQGIILTGYSHLQFSGYGFLHIDNAQKAQAWIREILPQVTHSNWAKFEDGKAIKPKSALNIAVTPEGLTQLGFPGASLQTTFPVEFVEGMTDPLRAQQLGDVGINAPDDWEDPWRPKKNIHLLLILQTSVDENMLTEAEWRSAGMEKLDRMYESYKQGFEAADIREVSFEAGCLSRDRKEHFGFHDGIAQPEIKGSPKQPKESQVLLEPGEFVLGYLNEDHNFPPTPTVPVSVDDMDRLPSVPNQPSVKDFGKNGSYLVFRKLSQDVAGFRRYFRDEFPDAQANARELAQAKVVGRWPSGAPLLLAPDEDAPHLASENHFFYGEKDPHGFKCPMGSHIRRTNPRDSLFSDPQESLTTVNRRQIIRRGVPYGTPLPEHQFEDDGQLRGLLFFCINASISRQFEFIQQTWVNNPYFNNLHNERDPLMGYNPDNSARQMTIPQTPVSTRCSLPNFVVVKGGGYFFIPSLSALSFLANMPKPIQ